MGDYKLVYDEQIIFLVILNYKSALCAFGEYAKHRKKACKTDLSSLILYQNQTFMKSLFDTLDRFEWSKKTSHASVPCWDTLLLAF